MQKSAIRIAFLSLAILFAVLELMLPMMLILALAVVAELLGWLHLFKSLFSLESS